MTGEGVSKGSMSPSSRNSLKKKTGGWRSTKPVFTDRCRGCGICVSYCPEGCIELTEAGGKKVAKADYDYCKGCMLCASLCPFKAIEKMDEK